MSRSGEGNGITALYCRVSTTAPDLSRQRQLTGEYATEQLGVAPADIELYLDKQTGTDTDRDGYRVAKQCYGLDPPD